MRTTVLLDLKQARAQPRKADMDPITHQQSHATSV